jgi:hypothetical protein
VVLNANKVCLIIAVICFAIAVLVGAGTVTFGKVPWEDLGLFFGFLSFLV